MNKEKNDKCNNNDKQNDCINKKCYKYFNREKCCLFKDKKDCKGGYWLFVKKDQ